MDFFEHAKKIRQIIGTERSFHMQVVSKDFASIVDDAETFWSKVDPQVYVKIPTSLAGLKAIQYLKKRGNCNITATATYSKIQGMLAIEAGADYLAVYTSRVANVGGDPYELIASLKDFSKRSKHHTKIMASSIKNVTHITDSFDAGADAVTFTPDILEKAFENATLNNALDDFAADWEQLYGAAKINYLQ